MIVVSDHADRQGFLEEFGRVQGMTPVRARLAGRLSLYTLEDVIEDEVEVTVCGPGRSWHALLVRTRDRLRVIGSAADLKQLARNERRRLRKKSAASAR